MVITLKSKILYAVNLSYFAAYNSAIVCLVENCLQIRIKFILHHSNQNIFTVHFKNTRNLPPVTQYNMSYAKNRRQYNSWDQTPGTDLVPGVFLCLFIKTKLLGPHYKKNSWDRVYDFFLFFSANSWDQNMRLIVCVSS